jgi:chromosome segregation ATPase
MAGFGGSVKLTGESEYKKALKSITQGLKETGSEMKLLSAQYASNDKNTAALAQKSADLVKKLDLQKKALEDLKNQYKQMEATYTANAAKQAELGDKLQSEKAKLAEIGKTLGTTSKEYQAQAKVVDALEKEYTEGETAQDRLNTSLTKMRTEMNNAEASIQSAENTLDSFNTEMDETGTETEETGGKFEKFGNVAGAVLKGLGVAMAATAAAAVALGKTIVDLASSTATYGDEIDKESQKLQLSSDTYQKLDYALRRNGSSIDQVSKGIKTITNDLGDFANGTKGAEDKYKALGVSLQNTDGSMKSAEQVLTESITALANMEDVTQRNAIAQDLFGKSYQ